MNVFWDPKVCIGCFLKTRLRKIEEGWLAFCEAYSWHFRANRCRGNWIQTLGKCERPFPVEDCLPAAIDNLSQLFSRFEARNRKICPGRGNLEETTNYSRTTSVTRFSHSWDSNKNAKVYRRARQFYGELKIANVESFWRLLSLFGKKENCLSKHLWYWLVAQYTAHWFPLVSPASTSNISVATLHETIRTPTFGPQEMKKPIYNFSNLPSKLLAMRIFLLLAKTFRWSLDAKHPPGPFEKDRPVFDSKPESFVGASFLDNPERAKGTTNFNEHCFKGNSEGCTQYSGFRMLA